MAGLSKSGPGGMDGMGAADIFAQFFGGGGGGMDFGFDFGPGGGRRRGKGEDTTVPYDVTLEDLYNGKAVKLSMEKEIVCGVCKGYVALLLDFAYVAEPNLRSGAKGSAKPKKCAKCEGKGWTFTQTQVSALSYLPSVVHS